jgi:hypothetical protein
MEVEISRDSLDCSSNWPVALVADNSHVCSPRQGRKPTKSGSCALFLSHLMPQLMPGNPSEMKAERVKMKRRFDDAFQNDWLGQFGLTSRFGFFAFSSCDFVDRSICPEKQRRSTKYTN